MSLGHGRSPITDQVATGIGAIDLAQMALRQGLAIPPHRAIAGTAGSDDHGGIYPGSAWTVVPGVQNVPDLLAAMAAGEVRAGGEDGSVEKMATTGFRIIAGATLSGERPPAHQTPGPDVSHGRSAEAEKLIEYMPLLATMTGAQVRSPLSTRYEHQVARALLGSGSGFPVLGVLRSVGSFVDAHLYIAPYLGVHGYFGRERQQTRALRRELFPDRSRPLKVGLFVDELDEIHGVATMYQNLERLAAGSRDDLLRIVRCGTGDGGDAICLPALATVPMPLYDGRALGVPSLLDVLDHVAGEDYDVLHFATPGPLGLAAMVAGMTLGVPIVGAYHTEFGTYAQVLSGDALVAEIVEVLVREFYERCAVVAVPSRSTAEALEGRGYQIDRFEVLRNGVDTLLYRPDRRDETLRQELGGGRTLLLYVGRVSREKGLTGLTNSYLELRRRRDDVHLVIAGDGPYREELEARLGTLATFTGFVRGEGLARIFASCDIFAFPSTTDTLGRAVAEAQASGLPAVVFGMGGPRECIRPGTSGFVAAPGDEAGFMARVEELVDDAVLRGRMGAAARAFAETLSWEAVLDGLIDLYRDIVTVPPPSALTSVPTLASVERRAEVATPVA